MFTAARIARFLGSRGAELLRHQRAALAQGPERVARGLLITGALAACGAVASLEASAEEQRAVTEQVIQGAAEPKEPDLWDQWARVRGFLSSWRSRGGEGGAGPPLPVDKLKCHLPPGGFDPTRYRPVVLVSCGSFNPPTHMHLRMMELAQQALTQAGHDVLGGYLSPVNDAYWKRALAPGQHRVAMCRLATANSDSLMVDPWEVEQRQYTRTLFVLRHVASALQRAFEAGAQPSVERVFATAGEPGPVGCPTSPPPRVMLVCGADVVLSMADPAVWRQDLLEELLSHHGVVCISRNGSDVEALLQRPGTLLHTYRGNVVVVQEPVPNDISSSRVRHQLEQGHTVKYLVPDSVLRYIYQHGLYGTAAHRPALLRVGEQQESPPPTPGAEPKPRVRKPVYCFDPQLGILVDAEDLATPHPL